MPVSLSLLVGFNVKDLGRLGLLLGDIVTVRKIEEKGPGSDPVAAAAAAAAGVVDEGRQFGVGLVAPLNGVKEGCTRTLSPCPPG